MDDLARLLGATALCRGLSRAELLRVAEAGRVERWPRGATVMEEGAQGPRVVVLLEGRVDVVKRDADGQDRVLAEVGAGGVLGEMALLHDEPRSATVRAAESLRVFAIDRHTFQEMIEDGDPAALKMGFAIARVLAGRVLALNDKIVDLLARVPDEPPIQELAEYRNKLLTRWDF